jgi:hypothetical protein
MIFLKYKLNMRMFSGKMSFYPGALAPGNMNLAPPLPPLESPRRARWMPPAVAWNGRRVTTAARASQGSSSPREEGEGVAPALSVAEARRKRGRAGLCLRCAVLPSEEQERRRGRVGLLPSQCPPPVGLLTRALLPPLTHLAPFVSPRAPSSLWRWRPEHEAPGARICEDDLHRGASSLPRREYGVHCRCGMWSRH